MDQQRSTNETWRPVVGFEGRYEVSDRGRVRSLFSSRGRRRLPKELVQTKLNNGYLQVHERENQEEAKCSSFSARRVLWILSRVADTSSK